MDWFLYDRDLRHERVKAFSLKFNTLILSCIIFKNAQTYFKNIPWFTPQDFSRYIWPFCNIIHEGVNLALIVFNFQTLIGVMSRSK